MGRISGSALFMLLSWRAAQPSAASAQIEEEYLSLVFTGLTWCRFA